MKPPLITALFIILAALSAPITAQHLPLVGNADKGKTIAKERCAACHGLNGVLARSGAPFIAGMEQAYLVRSLMAYSKGARSDPAMKESADELNPMELANVSAYYSQLATPWQGAVPDEKSRAIIKDIRAIKAARHIVDGCQSCHSQTNRYQKDEAVPSLNGMPLEYFVPALKSYLNGQRVNQYMKQFKASLNDKEIYSIGAYYASQPPQKAPPPKTGNAAAGKSAARHCAGCHGDNGNSLNPHIPNLAGHSANYLAKAIKDYRDGKRHNLLMLAPVKHLSNTTIANLAAYYARQQPESQLHRDLNTDTAFNPLQDGKKLSAACNSCHGVDGNSTKPGTPSLTGLDVKYIVRATRAYQTNLRRHPAMHEIVAYYSDTDIEKMAYFYATRQPVNKQKPVAGDEKKGALLSKACVDCHGEKGISNNPATTPSLAGQDARYIVAATRAYGTGQRQHDGMKNIAQKLTPNELKDLAAWFASQNATQVTTYLPVSPRQLIGEQCELCHGEQGRHPQPGVPRLAGQLEPYLVLALKEYQEGTRKNHTMEAIASVLSLLEIKAVATYYAKQ